MNIATPHRPRESSMYRTVDAAVQHSAAVHPDWTVEDHIQFLLHEPECANLEREIEQLGSRLEDFVAGCIPR